MIGNAHISMLCTFAAGEIVVAWNWADRQFDWFPDLQPLWRSLCFFRFHFELQHMKSGMECFEQRHKPLLKNSCNFDVSVIFNPELLIAWPSWFPNLFSNFELYIIVLTLLKGERNRGTCVILLPCSLFRSQDLLKACHFQAGWQAIKNCGFLYRHSNYAYIPFSHHENTIYLMEACYDWFDYRWERAKNTRRGSSTLIHIE